MGYAASASSRRVFGPGSFDRVDTMRVAIVSDALTLYGGAERVLESILDLYPQADLLALVDFVPPGDRGFMRGCTPRTTFIQRLPGAKRHFRKYFHLWPIAIEQLDLSGYDLVICNHYSVANGVITGPGQVQVSYTHSPMRYAWDLQDAYLQEAGLARGARTIAARTMLHKARLWDVAASFRIDRFAANSAFVAERIRKFYRRDASVIHPPVFVDQFAYREAKEDYYLFLGRLVPYKRADLLVEAFRRMPNRKLVIAGDGPQFADLQKRLPGNVTMLGRVAQDKAVSLLSHARAYLYPAIEDFGIAPLEAQASGTPVIGLYAGGLRETIRGLDHATPTGAFFHQQTADAVIDAVEAFEQAGAPVRPADCRDNARRFSPAQFAAGFSAFVNEAMAASGKPMVRSGMPQHGLRQMDRTAA